MNGDTISRSELKDDIRKWITNCYMVGDDQTPEVLRLCIDLVDAQSVVDAAPAVHGKWQFDSGVDYCWKCTECNHTAPSCSGHSDSQDKTLYCPYCGARMDGGEEI